MADGKNLVAFFKNYSYFIKEVIMKKKKILLPFLLAWSFMGAGAQQPEGYLLLDDFSGDTSALGTGWEGFTDQVMGGRSEMSVVRIPDPAGPYLSMRGDVSLERNGGFIQVRLMLKNEDGYFDGSIYRGVRVVVRGEGAGYYIFLRTRGTRLPWKFYTAPVPVTEEWSTVDIPWSAFGPGDYGRMGPPDTGMLKSLALSAYGKEFTARLDVKEVGLY